MVGRGIFLQEWALVPGHPQVLRQQESDRHLSGARKPVPVQVPDLPLVEQGEPRQVLEWAPEEG